MKRLFSFAIYTMALVSFISGSCSKDDDAPQQTKTEMITSSSWKFEKATASGFDISAQVPACFKDNEITFSTNGSGTVTEGTLACSPPAPPTFTWSFQNNETTLNLSTPLISGGSGNFTIVTLNQTNLVISQDMIIPPATMPVTVVITFKH